MEALILGVLAACNGATVWWFARYAPARWDVLPIGEIPAAPALVEYNDLNPDVRGLV